MLKTDILDRGIPWTELILRDRNMPNDLNLHLSQRVSVALVFLLLSLMMLIAVEWRGYFLTPLLAILFIVAGRYWVVGTAGRRKRSVVAVVTLSVAAIAGLAYAYHMLVLIPLALLAYVLLFVRHRYSHRDGHSRGLIVSFIAIVGRARRSLCRDLCPAGLAGVGVWRSSPGACDSEWAVLRLPGGETRRDVRGGRHSNALAVSLL